jgi:hypothetical protein
LDQARRLLSEERPRKRQENILSNSDAFPGWGLSDRRWRKGTARQGERAGFIIYPSTAIFIMHEAFRNGVITDQNHLLVIVDRGIIIRKRIKKRGALDAPQKPTRKFPFNLPPPADSIGWASFCGTVIRIQFPL